MDLHMLLRKASHYIYYFVAANVTLMFAICAGALIMGDIGNYDSLLIPLIGLMKIALAMRIDVYLAFLSFLLTASVVFSILAGFVYRRDP